MLIISWWLSAVRCTEAFTYRLKPKEKSTYFKEISLIFHWVCAVKGSALPQLRTAAADVRNEVLRKRGIVPDAPHVALTRHNPPAPTWRGAFSSNKQPPPPRKNCGSCKRAARSPPAALLPPGQNDRAHTLRFVEDQKLYLAIFKQVHTSTAKSISVFAKCS